MRGAALCLTAGAAAAYGGWRLLKACERKPDESGFTSFLAPRNFGVSAGYLLMFLGLMLCMIFAPMFWIGRAR